MADEKELELERYFENLPEWPHVDVYNKKVDGLIPSCRLKSWENIAQVTADLYSDGGGDEYIFRGQQHYQWYLQPSLDRVTSAVINEVIAKWHLRQFRLSIRGRLPRYTTNVENDLELWAMGQHHGLATPLLDWTKSPYVALFFAFVDKDDPAWVAEDGKPNNYSRVVFALNRSFIEDLGDSELEKYPQIIEPFEDEYGRLVNQAGLFTMAPYSETLESSLLRALTDSSVDVDDPKEVAKFIVKIHIPNTESDRAACLNRLRSMNIHHASLFPDVIGASGYCNELVREYATRAGNQLGDKSARESPKDEDTFAVKDLTLKEDLKVYKALIDAMDMNEQVSAHASFDMLLPIAKKLVTVILENSAVDWYKRETQLARYRILVSRELSNLSLDTEAARDAAEKAVTVAAKIAQGGE